jgi:hypothetical protein
MANFKQTILEAVADDTILAVKILPKDADYFPDEQLVRFIPGNRLAGSVISLEEALKALDYQYDDGFGSQDCHDIYMWSNDWVYYIHEYDGSTCIRSVPRNPG